MALAVMAAVQQLASALNRLSASGGGQRGKKKGGPKRKGNAPAAGPAVQITVRRTELFCEVQGTQAGKGGSVGIQPQQFAWLSKLALLFELWRPLQMTMELRSMSPPTAGGSVALGVDWFVRSMQMADVSRARVLNCSPSIDVRSTVSRKMPLPPSLLRTRTWYSTEVATGDSPGFLVWYANGPDTVGEVWVTYVVELAGARG